MITEHEELARYRIADQLRSAEDRAHRRENRNVRREQPHRPRRHPGRSPVPAPDRSGRPVRASRRELAGLLRRLADRLEPQPTQPRGSGLTVVR